MLKLYYARNSCALASHIALEEAGAPYEAVRVDFASAQQRTPEYLAKFLESEIRKWAAPIKASGVSVE